MDISNKIKSVNETSEETAFESGWVRRHQCLIWRRLPFSKEVERDFLKPMEESDLIVTQVIWGHTLAHTMHFQQHIIFSTYITLTNESILFLT